MNTIIEKYLYLIEIDSKFKTNKNRIIKFGEMTNVNRPISLVAKYIYNGATASILRSDIKLNLDNNIRITDKNFRTYICKAHSDITRVNADEVADILCIPYTEKLADGFNEFLSVPVDVDLDELIKETLDYFKKHKNEATGKVSNNLVLEKPKHHVSANLCKQIHDKIFTEDGIDLYRVHDKNILIVGQFKETFIAKFSERNLVTILADSELKYEDVEVNIIRSTEELEDMENDFDIIISNPPYGKTGAEITKLIIDNFNYQEFVNLLPANDYHRGKNNDLYKYANLESMESIKNGFDDATVTTHLTLINKKPDINRTEAEFEIENYIDPSLKKYFYENAKRPDYSTKTYIKLDVIKAFDITKTLLFGVRDINHKHLPYAKDCITYKWNVDESINSDYIEEYYKDKVCFTQYDAQTKLASIELNSVVEKKNFSKFMYSIIGFKFLAKVFTAVNVDGACILNTVMPKVDWTKEWTVEEILRDYNYSENEIKEVMDDLINFKYMDE